jgi:hypothetical protein
METLTKTEEDALFARLHAKAIDALIPLEGAMIDQEWPEAHRVIVWEAIQAIAADRLAEYRGRPN